jgi:sigma-E factor negative regulatory protein RseA
MNPDRIDRDKMTGTSPADDADDCAQRLSALLDGELGAADCQALVERLRQDDEACRRWALLNCVGDAIRSAEVGSFHSDGFVARVSAALEREPTVLAPAALPQRSAVRRWLLPGAGVAAAAAAVLIAVGLPSQQGSSPEATLATATPVPTTTVAKAPTPVVDRSPQLERYLAAHRELAEPTLMPHSTPYVRTSGTVLMQEGR